MRHADIPELKQTLTAVYDFYRRPLTSTSVTLWFNALHGYELGIVRAALTAHMRNPDNGQFLPLPADIVKLVDGGSDDAALMAWAKLDRALRSVGTYRTVVFDDPLIHYAVAALGGWIKLGAFTEDDWKFQRQPFVVMYRGARQRPGLEYPARLPGIAEMENGAKHLEPPMLIGDEARCREVLAAGATGPALTLTPLRALLPQLERPREATA